MTFQLCYGASFSIICIVFSFCWRSFPPFRSRTCIEIFCHLIMSGLLAKGYVIRKLSDYVNLSKAFDFLNHELFSAKLPAYDVSRPALELIYSYLHERQQRVKINGSFSTLKQTSVGAFQGKVLGPMLFNIFINDFFYLVKDAEILQLVR